MVNYAPSTRARIADLITGMRVDTAVLASADYLKTGPTATEAIFNVGGRIKIMQLFMEVITDLSAQACVMFYTYTSTTPSIGVQPISVVSASMSGMLRGARHICVGLTAGTACVIDAQTGISPAIMTEKMIIGIESTAFLTAAFAVSAEPVVSTWKPANVLPSSTLINVKLVCISAVYPPPSSAATS